MRILDGKICSEYLIEQIKNEINSLPEIRKPKIAIIEAGDNISSKIYINAKIKACKQAGIDVTHHIIHPSVSIPSQIEEGIRYEISTINNDDTYDGMIVQLPLPEGVSVNKIIKSISPEKDIDGFHPENFGKMALGQKSFRPATAYGICKMLQHYNIETKGKYCVVIGRSNIVGKPISIMMSNDFEIGNATVTLTHIETPKELLIEQTKKADIIIIAVGITNFLTSDMVKENAVVIDVGINRLENNKIVGDVDFDNVSKKCSWITPVPGGVGPMTVAALLLNTLESWKNKINTYEKNNIST